MIIIKGGTLLTMDKKNPFKFQGDLLINKKGKIEAVQEKIETPTKENTIVIDAEGKTVTPGMIDIHTHLGLHEEGLAFEGSDINEESDPITPELRAIDGINPWDKGLQEACKHGITSTVVSPGSANPIGGQTAAIKTRGKIIDNMILKEPAGLKISLGENPKTLYHGKDKSPMTRMSIAALIRKSFVEAQNYLEEQDNYKNEKESSKKSKERDLQKESLSLVLQQKIPLKAHAHRADDILTAIRIAKEFNLEMVINHCTEGHKIAEILEENDYPVILGPALTSRSKVELKELSFKTPSILADHKITFAITTDHPVVPAYALPLCTALAVREGLDKETALKSITINAAKIAKIDHLVGSLEKNKDGDVLVFSGDPLSLEQKPEHVFVSGTQVI